MVWTSGFVLLTLLLAAPMLGPVMRWCRIAEVPKARRALMRSILRHLVRSTRQSIKALQRDPDFISDGVNWSQVWRLSSHREELKKAYDLDEEAEEEQGLDGGQVRGAGLPRLRRPSKAGGDSVGGATAAGDVELSPRPPGAIFLF